MQRGKQKRTWSEDLLILMSAGTAARRLATREQADELGALVDWSLVSKLLQSRKLLTLLGPRLIEIAENHGAGTFATEVTQAVNARRRQGAFLQIIAERVMQSLANAAIPCTALKGPALSEALYDDVGRRPTSDIDLLVAQERLHDAVEIVRELGYKAPIDHVDDSGLPLLHFALNHEGGQFPRVELHWRIHWYERSFARERLLAPDDVPAGNWRPAPIDEITALLLFYARDGFTNLRHAVDLGACWDIVGSKLDPGALDETTRIYPALTRVLQTAVNVAESTVGLPRDRLTEHGGKLSKRSRIAVRLANPLPYYTNQPQLYAEMGLMDGLLAPPGGLGAFFKRQVAPPREVLHQHAQRAERRVSSTLGHSVRVLARYGLGLARLLRAPERTRLRHQAKIFRNGERQ